nr:ABC transporter permease [uncultured Draconibacterium sp.]
MEQIKYFFRTSICNLFFRRKFTVTNLIGLSIGLMVSLLILLYVRYETSFENFNPNAKNIYRIVEKNTQDGTVGEATPLALSDVLKNDFPEVDKVIGLMKTYKAVKIGENKFEDLKGAIVEKDFFDFFNIPLTEGNSTTIFKDPYEVVVTSKLAEKLFGDVNPIGKTMEYENHIFTVSGLVNEIPKNSILNFEFFLSDKFRYVSYPDLNDRWYEFGLHTFVTFKKDIIPDGFEQNLARIEDKYYPDFMKNRFTYEVIAFKGSHLNTNIQNDLVPAVSQFYLWILFGIATGILLIAGLNFVNISIATSSKRNIETGIRKVNGASSSALIYSFFAETAFLTIISLVLAFGGLYFATPAFESLTGKTILVDLGDPVLWLGVAGFCFLTIVLSGIYPAVVLSKPTPAKVLLRNKMESSNKLTFQKSFTMFQFALTIALAIVLFAIFKQVRFMQNHETGFNRRNLLAIPAYSLGSYGPERLNNANLFTQELEKYQSQYGFGKASVTEFVPGFGFRNLFQVYPDENADVQGIEMLSCDVDENFADVFGMHLKQGRFFSKDLATDHSNSVVINQAALKKLGWKSIEGKTVGLISKDNKKHVVGVINDINVKSLQYPVQPMIYQFGRHHNFPGYITLRLNQNQRAEAMAFIMSKWEELFPEVPFTYESVEEKYRSAYGEEIRLARITGTFSVLAMILSLFGILALSTLQFEKRTKEIGIRKVNGAKVSEILTMLNKDFIKWVAIAFVIATPIAYYAMNKWLENFAYKTNLSWWIFALAGVLALGIALLTVSWQSWRAATRNPVEALRYE